MAVLIKNLKLGDGFKSVLPYWASRLHLARLGMKVARVDRSWPYGGCTYPKLPLHQRSCDSAAAPEITDPRGPGGLVLIAGKPVFELLTGRSWPELTTPFLFSVEFRTISSQTRPKFPRNTSCSLRRMKHFGLYGERIACSHHPGSIDAQVPQRAV